MVSLKRALAVNVNLFVWRRTPVIVYCMGRVGSCSLFQSLCEHGVFAIHAHILHPPNLRAKKGKRPGTSKWTYDHIIRKDKPAKIISLVRNPVECMASAFAPRVRARPVSELGCEGLLAPSLDEGSLSDQFEKGYFEQREHFKKLNWFDAEFKAALGIDVYNHPFSAEDGYGRFREGRFDVLIMRTELDDARKAQIVSDFLGLEDLKPNFKISRARVGEEQSYGEIYKVFRQRVKVPQRYLNTIINSRYAQHFFTPETLNAMKQRFIREDARVS